MVISFLRGHELDEMCAEHYKTVSVQVANLMLDAGFTNRWLGIAASLRVLGIQGPLSRGGFQKLRQEEASFASSQERRANLHIIFMYVFSHTISCGLLLQAAWKKKRSNARS